jgi:hypothetical protein
MTAAPVTSVGFLAPMPSELRPLVRRLHLGRGAKGDGAWHTGRLGAATVVATTTGIGTASAARATERLLAERRVDHVVVIGVAGGLAEGIGVGDVVIPDTVVDDSGAVFHPVPMDGGPTEGHLFTTDDFIKDRARLDDLARSGFVAIVGLPGDQRRRVRSRRRRRRVRPHPARRLGRPGPRGAVRPGASESRPSPRPVGEGPGRRHEGRRRRGRRRTGTLDQELRGRAHPLAPSREPSPP